MVERATILVRSDRMTADLLKYLRLYQIADLSIPECVTIAL